MKVYLGGPINGCTDEEAHGWRDAAATLLEDLGHTWLDPMARDYRGVEDAKFVEIVEGDKHDIADCDVLLMSCPKPSVGTSMEVYLGWTLGKRVIAVVPPEERVSPWLRYHADIYAGSVNDAIKETL